jgi:acylphosphatase
MHGVVQGVGFRAAAQKIANELHLKGFIRNLSNGAIELVVQGSSENIHLLIHRLKARFTINKIDEISHPVTIHSDHFEIR